MKDECSLSHWTTLKLKEEKQKTKFQAQRVGVISFNPWNNNTMYIYIQYVFIKTKQEKTIEFEQ